MCLGKILVIGGRGYVGNHILNKAALMGIKAQSLSRRSIDNIQNDNPNISYIQGDALEPNDFVEAIKHADTIGFLYFIL